jgi:hypothetical protein
MKENQGVSLQMPVAYRLEYKPGDYCFSLAGDLFKWKYWKGARIHSLFTSPQNKCPDKVAVYKGKFWVEPKYSTPTLIAGAIPLYLGPMVYEPGISDEVLLLFPSMAKGDQP